MVTVHPHPPHCTVCGAALLADAAVCSTGYEGVELGFGEEAHPGLRVISTQHRYSSS